METTADEDLSVIGGSVAKAACPNEHTILEDDDDVGQPENGEKNEASGGEIDDESQPQKEIGNLEVDCDDCEHDEPTAPKTCCPSNIFVVMTM